MLDDSQDISNSTFQQHCPKQRDQEEDSGFQAWQNDYLPTQNQTNLLRNFKSQLLMYEEKYKKLDSNKTVPIKLPALDYLKHKKYTSINHSKNSSHTIPQQQNALTQRKHLQLTSNTENLCKHKSIELTKKPSASKQSKRFTSQKSKLRQNNTIDHTDEKNHAILVTKVQQMKFSENQKRVRKRDLYLAIFGQRGKGKVQKIQFDDQNVGYQCYLERKNQQSKLAGSSQVVIELEKNKIRCSTQLNNRNFIKKPQVLGQSANIMTKNNSHLPMRY